MLVLFKLLWFYLGISDYNPVQGARSQHWALLQEQRNGRNLQYCSYQCYYVWIYVYCLQFTSQQTTHPSLNSWLTLVLYISVGKGSQIFCCCWLTGLRKQWLRSLHMLTKCRYLISFLVINFSELLLYDKFLTLSWNGLNSVLSWRSKLSKAMVQRLMLYW